MFIKLASNWATIFVLPLTCANFTDVCNETYSSTQGLQCFPCQPGYTKTDDCSTNQTRSQCMQCKEGTYQPYCISANATEQCRNCTKCAVYIEHCTIYQNAVCRGNDSTKDDLDDNRKQTRDILLVVTSWAVVTLLFTLFISTCLYRKRRMRHRHLSNNIINNSEYKHHDLPEVDKRKCRNNLNLHAISGDVSKGMPFTPNDFSEQEHLSLPEVVKSKDENIFNRHPNTWKWSKDTSKDTENRHNEGKTNNGIELPLAENQNVDVKEIAEFKEEENTDDRNNEGKTSNGTQLSLAENQDVDVKELAKSKEEENTENRNNEGQTNNGTQLPLAENQEFDVKETAESEDEDKNREAKNESKRKAARTRISKIVVPVAVVPPSIDKLTRESFQSSADGLNAQENTENSNNGQTNNDVKLSPAENQNVEEKELAEYEKRGTQTLKIDWLTIFLKLAKSFPPTEWEMFALNLLNNCQRVRHFNAHDAVEEIKLEARNEYSAGWVIRSYMKVFNKWLNIMGDTEATIEQIEQAVSHSIDSKEVMDLVLSIKRDPPILPSPQSLVPKVSQHIWKNQLPCFALHESEIPGASCSVQFRSRQMHSIQASRRCTCSTFGPNIEELQEISNCQDVQTLFQYNKRQYETNGNIEYQTPNKQKGRGKKRKPKISILQNKLKLRKLESYVRKNAKQNLLSDHIQIRQSDYDVYMEHVIALLMKECKVIKKVVLSITYQAFCEVKEIRTSQNETLYLLYGGKPRLCLTKDVYDDLAVYGKCVRPKLIAYLDEQKVKYNKLDVDTFLFISFKGDAVFEQSGFQGQRERKVEAITHSLPVSTANRKDFDTSNKDTTAGTTSTVACQTEDVNNNSKPENQIQDEEIIDMNKTCEKVCDATSPPRKRDASEFKIEMDDEMEIIRNSLFPTGEESFKIVNEDTIPSKLKSFVNQD